MRENSGMGNYDEELEREEERGFAVIGSYPTAKAAHEAGLAVLAAGHAYWVNWVEGRYLLFVASAHAEILRKEVAAAESFNRFWPPGALSLPHRPASKWPTVGFSLFIVFAFWVQGRWPAVEELGLSSSSGIWESGEWWRALTAVTLHADAGHLAGNLLGIGLFAYLSCRYFGNGLAWCLIFVSSGLANFSNTYTHLGESFQSLGASTAVFAALGLLSGFPVGAFIRTRERIETRDWLIPFFGGCVLFAWMGGGEFPTDVSGHLWAFTYGGLLAIVAVWLSLQEKVGDGLQRLLLAVSICGMAMAWTFALSVF